VQLLALDLLWLLILLSCIVLQMQDSWLHSWNLVKVQRVLPLSFFRNNSEQDLLMKFCWLISGSQLKMLLEQVMLMKFSMFLTRNNNGLTQIQFQLFLSFSQLISKLSLTAWNKSTHQKTWNKLKKQLRVKLRA